MKEGKRMQQLECRTGVHDPLIATVTTGTDEPPVAECRAQALATRQHQPPDLVNRSTQIGIQCRPTLAFTRKKTLQATVH